MERGSNPFSPGAGSQPPELTGRDAILDNARVILTRLKNQHPDRSQMLIGLRGVGKTVLLNRVDGLARSLGCYSAMIEAPENKRLAELLAPELRRLLLQMDLLQGAKEKLWRALAGVRNFAKAFNVHIGDVGVGITLAAGIADTGDIDRDLTELLVLVGEAAAERSTVVALMIDELQYVQQAELGAFIAGLHRVSQLNLPLVLFGAGLPQLVALAGNAKSYAKRLLFDEVGPLERRDAIRALEEPVEKVGAKFTPDALDEIVRATNGYPYFIQEWGKHAWIAASTPLISREDAIAAGKPAVAELDRSFFRVRFDRLTPTERDYLRAMAELGPMAHRSGDIAALLGRPVEQVAPVRARVITKGMAYAPAHGDTAFTVPMFDQFMKRAMPVFQPRPPRRRATQAAP